MCLSVQTVHQQPTRATHDPQLCRYLIDIFNISTFNKLQFIVSKTTAEKTSYRLAWKCKTRVFRSKRITFALISPIQCNESLQNTSTKAAPFCAFELKSKVNRGVCYTEEQLWLVNPTSSQFFWLLKHVIASSPGVLALIFEAGAAKKLASRHVSASSFAIKQQTPWVLHTTHVFSY